MTVNPKLAAPPIRGALSWLAAALLALLGLALPARAQAEVKRYGFLVGSNRGASHEVPLRYAESDVEAVARALVDLGGFPSERVVRLIAPNAPRVRRALLDLIVRIQQDLRGGGEAVLFAYYSGHADAQNLHLGGSELPMEELSGLVRASQAKLKVLLVDACRSGALTQVKGGRPVQSFQIGIEDLLRNEGYAVITSSSAGEDAQESEAFRSSVFTHHFLAGLRGLGDVNLDRLVTLGEAYAYSAEQTLKTSLNTLAGSQHATFEYDLRGRADPVLADLRARGERAELVLGATGDYLLMDPDSGALLFEAGAKLPRLSLQVQPGRYRVRARSGSGVFETEVALAAGESRTLRPADMRSVPIAQVVRKGETAAQLANGPVLSGTMHGPLATGYSSMFGLQIGWAFELPRFSLVPRLGYVTGRAQKPADRFRSHTLDEMTAELAGLYVVDLGRLALAPLVSVGWGVFKHRLTEVECPTMGSCTSEVRPQGLITTVGGWAAWPLGRGFTLEASLELANFYLRRQDSRIGVQANAARSGTLTYRSGAGLGYRY
jgi:hypothetical protein